MMLKKKIVFCLTALFMLLVACNNKEKELNIINGSELKIEQAENIEITDGKNGQKVNTNNKEKIQQFSSIFKDVTLKELKNQGSIKGYSYAVSFKKNNLTENMLIIGKIIKWKNKYYIVKNNLTSEIEDFYNSLNK